MSDVPQLRVRASRDATEQLLLPGAVARDLHELMEATIAVSGRHWILEIDDEVIVPRPNTGYSDGLQFDWKPGFFAGEVQVRLRDTRGDREHLFRLDVGAAPGKLGSQTFAKLLDELNREQPEFLLGSEPAQRQLGSLGSHDDPLLAYAKLRMHMPEFLSILARVLSDPTQRLRQGRQFLPLASVRRADRHAVRSMMREPALAARFVDGHHAEASISHRFRVDAPIVEPHVDEPGNRCIKALVFALLRRIADCRRLLTSRLKRDRASDTRTGLTKRWPARSEFLDRIENALRHAVHGPILSQVTRAEVSAAGLNTISAHPVYARAHRLGRAALGLGLADGGAKQDMWMPPTFELYERWCFVALRRLLLARCASVTASAQQTQSDHERAFDGQLVDGARIWLGYQVRFPADGLGHRDNAGFRSVSGLRFPDLVLALERGVQRRWLVLDAKYRAKRSGVLDGMASAHIYQDSLRWYETRPTATLLLVPAERDNTKWLMDPRYRQQHGVGALVAAPGEILELERVLDEFLAD